MFPTELPAGQGCSDSTDLQRFLADHCSHIVCAGCNGSKSDKTLDEMRRGEAGPDWPAYLGKIRPECRSCDGLRKSMYGKTRKFPTSIWSGN